MNNKHGIKVLDGDIPRPVLTLEDTWINEIQRIEQGVLDIRNQIHDISRAYNVYLCPDNNIAIKHLGNSIAELKRAVYYIRQGAMSDG